jgi:hypothetical protein
LSAAATVAGVVAANALIETGRQPSAAAAVTATIVL